MIPSRKLLLQKRFMCLKGNNQASRGISVNNNMVKLSIPSMQQSKSLFHSQDISSQFHFGEKRTENEETRKSDLPE